jgi:hypothetical protein
MRYHVYGDNIIECERTVELFERALNLDCIRYKGLATTPTVFGKSKLVGDIQMVLFPGFSRWNHDILEHVSNVGGVLREAADCVVTKVEEGKEIPIIAIEYCNALPAGNQAWQRSGRAYSFAKAGIPYVYITEIGGYELDQNRNKKAPRMPNPALPFSYAAYSLQAPMPTLIVYKMSPDADSTNRTEYNDYIGTNDLVRYIAGIVTGKGNCTNIAEAEISTKTVNFVKKLSLNIRAKKGVYSNEEWGELYESYEQQGNMIEIIRSLKYIDWKKKVKKNNQTKTIEKLLSLSAEKARGITGKDLPFCIISKKWLEEYKNGLIKIYPKAPASFKQWLSNVDDLAICWISGFKPRGDDARPDRGLLPFLRMLIGEDTPVLSVVYGPAKKFMWENLLKDPCKLIQTNGLWEVILKLSDALIGDSKTNPKGKPIALTKEHWRTCFSESQNNNIMEENTVLTPLQYNENDVDTTLHLLFSLYLNNQCFESMCNPPGGDWSGISLLQEEIEYRWLSLPRVSANKHKRPDHVIQFPNENIILSIESKHYYDTLEDHIGPRLSGYCKDLFETPPGAKRECENKNTWTDNINDYQNVVYEYLSAAAFIKKNSAEIKKASMSSKCDLLFLINFDDNGTAIIEVIATTKSGRRILKIIQAGIHERSKSRELKIQIIFPEKN